MTKEEALDLALEALEYIHEGANNQGPHTGISWRCVAVKAEPAITAIKQARALDKKAENARELGLDYEPAGGTQVSKVWWDGEKLMAKPIPLKDFYQPAPECTRSHPHENMDSMCELRTEIARLRNENERVHVENRRLIDRIETIDVPHAAKRQWVGLTKTVVGNHLRRHALGDQPTFRQGFKEGVAFAEFKLKKGNI
jgi:hypothetical protein